jgi:hypothetical protein
MQNLEILIDRFVKWGTEDSLPGEDNLKELEIALMKLYKEYLELEDQFDEKEYLDPPKFEYDSIMKIVARNFPRLGYYNKVLNVTENIGIPEYGVGDACDDLADIIKDLMEVRWRLKNTSTADAIWHFKFLFKAHSGMHLVDLLKYLKEKE